mgnify:FL=1
MKSPTCTATAVLASGTVPKTWGNIPSRQTEVWEVPAQESAVSGPAAADHILLPLEHASRERRVPNPWVPSDHMEYGDVVISTAPTVPIPETLRPGVPPDARERPSAHRARARMVECIPVAGGLSSSSQDPQLILGRSRSSLPNIRRNHPCRETEYLYPVGVEFQPISGRACYQIIRAIPLHRNTVHCQTSWRCEDARS